MWIVFSLIATVTQVTRNLFSKKMVANYPPGAVALSRFIYALPVVLITYILLQKKYGSVIILSNEFYLWVSLMAISQISATLFRVKLFTYKSFAVSLTIVQVETIIVAIFGLFFLNEVLGLLSWVGLLIATFGLILASLSKYNVSFSSIKSNILTKPSLIALLTGFFLALAGMCAKRAFNHISGDNKIVESIFSLTFILIVEILLLLPFALYNNKRAVIGLFTKPLKPLIIGICSGIGSFCWLTAYSLTNIAYVRTVGQLEFIIATLLSVYHLKEKIYKYEYIGMFMVFTGSLIIVLISQL